MIEDGRNVTRHVDAVRPDDYVEVDVFGRFGDPAIFVEVGKAGGKKVVVDLAPAAARALAHALLAGALASERVSGLRR